MKSTRGFEGALDRIGERDAQRELHRAKQARRREKKDQHENPPAWAYRTVSGNRRNTGR